VFGFLLCLCVADAMAKQSYKKTLVRRQRQQLIPEEVAVNANCLNFKV